MKVENMVCIGSFNQPMDLEGLSSSVGCIEFGRNRYPAAYIRSEKGFVTVYRTGRYVMQGITSVAEADALYSEVKGILSPFCDVGLFTGLTVRNMVCTSDAGRTLDLDALFLRISMAGLDASFEPEVFPGMILRTDGCTYNIFSTGRFVILGCRNEADAERCESRLLSLFSDAERDVLSDPVRRDLSTNDAPPLRTDLRSDG